MTVLDRRIVNHYDDSSIGIYGYSTRSVKIFKKVNDDQEIPILTVNQVPESSFDEDFFKKVGWIASEAYNSPVFNNQRKSIIPINNFDKHENLILETILRDDFTSFEKIFSLIMIIHNNFYNLNQQNLEILMERFKRESEYPSNYLSWNIDDSLYTVLPIVQGRVPSFCTFSGLKKNNRSIEGLEVFNNTLRFMNFISNPEYGNETIFSENKHVIDFIPRDATITPREALITHRWLLNKNKRFYINESKKFLKILSLDESSLSLILPDMALIKERFNSEKVPVFFEKNIDKEHKHRRDVSLKEGISIDNEKYISLFVDEKTFDFMKFAGEGFMKLMKECSYIYSREPARIGLLKVAEEVGWRKFLDACNWWDDHLSSRYKFSLESESFKKLIEVCRNSDDDAHIPWELDIEFVDYNEPDTPPKNSLYFGDL